MSGECFLGIDLGTSSLKAMIADSEGKPLALSSVAYQFDVPQNGFAQQEPIVWWESCCKAIQDVVGKSEIAYNEIKSIGFSGQMHGVVMLDENFVSVHPAILHCDSRSDSQILDIHKTLGEELIRFTLYNPPYTGFMLPSLMWLRDNCYSTFKKIKYVMSPKDYLKFKLCGQIITDYSDASATLIFDFNAGTWSQNIIKTFNLEHITFPEIKFVTDIVGQTDTLEAKELGFEKTTLVTNGGGDQLMQMIGNGLLNPGDTCVNIGTSGQISFQSDTLLPTYEKNLNTFKSYQANRWIIMGAIMNAGLCFNWIRRLFDENDYKAIDRMIESVGPGSGGLIFLPYLTGERTPHFNPNLSGAFFGLTPTTNRSQLIRSVLEGVSFALFECMQIVDSLGSKINRLIASGGATNSLVWLQIQSDIYNAELQVANITEQAVFGGCISAAVGAGEFSSLSEACKHWVKYNPLTVKPNINNHRIYLEYYELFKELFQTSRNKIEKLTLLGRKL